MEDELTNRAQDPNNRGLNNFVGGGKKKNLEEDQIDPSNNEDQIDPSNNEDGDTVVRTKNKHTLDPGGQETRRVIAYCGIVTTGLLFLLLSLVHAEPWRRAETPVVGDRMYYVNSTKYPVADCVLNPTSGSTRRDGFHRRRTASNLVGAIHRCRLAILQLKTSL